MLQTVDLVTDLTPMSLTKLSSAAYSTEGKNAVMPRGLKRLGGD